MMLSRENEFKTIIDTGQKWAQFGAIYFFGCNNAPSRYHNVQNQRI